jgi:hypothetical protein
VLDGRDETDARSRILLVSLVLSVEVEIPEINVKLGVGAERGDEDVTTLGRPVDAVGVLVVECLCGKERSVS